MKRTPFGSWPCSIARAVDLLGDWWTPLVLREAVFGSRRFEEFQRNLGIGRNVLAQRLNRLVDEGLMDRVPYQDRPLRHEYVLTAKGRDFFPVLAAIIAWGDTWLADDEGAPVVLRHRPCGHETHARVVCAECGDALRVEDVEALAGPGLPARLADAAVASGRFKPRSAPDELPSPSPTPASTAAVGPATSDPVVSGAVTTGPMVSGPTVSGPMVSGPTASGPTVDEPGRDADPAASPVAPAAAP